MIFDIAGQGMSVGHSLRSHIEEHGNAVMKKFLPGAIDLRAVVSKHHFKFHVHLTINPGIKNFFIKSDADALDPYDAFDQALKKAEGKIRRYKEHQNHKHVSQKKVEALDEMASNTVDVNSYIVHHDHESNMQLNVTNKKIKQLPVLPLSEAVMHMDFESKENYMFVNEENDKITVLHKQSDGSIVCVEV